MIHLTSSLRWLDIVTSSLHQGTQIPNHKQLTLQSLRAARNGVTGHPASPAAPWISSELLPHSASFMNCCPLSWQCCPSPSPAKVQAPHNHIWCSQPLMSCTAARYHLLQAPSCTPLGPFFLREWSPQDLLPQRALPRSRFAYSPATAVCTAFSQLHSQAADFFGRAASAVSSCAGSERHEVDLLTHRSGCLASPGVLSSCSVRPRTRAGW